MRFTRGRPNACQNRPSSTRSSSRRNGWWCSMCWNICENQNGLGQIRRRNFITSRNYGFKSGPRYAGFCLCGRSENGKRSWCGCYNFGPPRNFICGWCVCGWWNIWTRARSYQFKRCSREKCKARSTSDGFGIGICPICGWWVTCYGNRSANKGSCGISYPKSKR